MLLGCDEGTEADCCCCCLSLGDLGTMAGGLVERGCTSLRDGLAGDGARFSLFFSTWWFCGLCSPPEPLELSIILQQQHGDVGRDQSTAPREVSDRRRLEDTRGFWSSSWSGWRCASCVVLALSLHPVCTHQAVSVDPPLRKRSNKRGLEA